MVRQVVWSPGALLDKKNILKYWRTRNHSNTYSKKLNALFKESIRITMDFPEIGLPTERVDVKIKIVRDYLIFYKFSDSRIDIMTIRSSRQDPEKFEDHLTDNM